MSDDNSIRGRVGVVRDENGSLGDPLVSSVIDLYKKKDGSWCLESSLNWPLCQTKQASDLRNRLIALATYLDGLKVLVGKSFGGLAFRILQSQGVDLCRMDDFGVDCLDELMEVLDNGEKDDITPLYPVEIGDQSALFAFDMGAALKAAPDLSSKKILIPFFEKEDFIELNLLCPHLPPWLRPYIEAKGLSLEQSEAFKGPGVALRIFREYLS